jgi:hypothetical protein
MTRKRLFDELDLEELRWWYRVSRSKPLGATALNVEIAALKQTVLSLLVPKEKMPDLQQVRLKVSFGEN